MDENYLPALNEELDAALEPLARLSEYDVSVLQDKDAPSPQIRKVAEATAIVLGLEPVKSKKGRQFLVVSRRQAHEIVSKPDLVQRMVEFTKQRLTISPDALRALRTYITNPLLVPQMVVRAHRTVGIVWRWVRAVFAVQMGRPTEEVIEAHQERAGRRLSVSRDQSLSEKDGVTPYEPNSARQRRRDLDILRAQRLQRRDPKKAWSDRGADGDEADDDSYSEVRERRSGRRKHLGKAGSSSDVPDAADSGIDPKELYGYRPRKGGGGGDSDSESLYSIQYSEIGSDMVRLDDDEDARIRRRSSLESLGQFRDSMAQLHSRLNGHIDHGMQLAGVSGSRLRRGKSWSSSRYSNGSASDNETYIKRVQGGGPDAIPDRWRDVFDIAEEMEHMKKQKRKQLRKSSGTRPRYLEDTALQEFRKGTRARPNTGWSSVGQAATTVLTSGRPKPLSSTKPEELAALEERRRRKMMSRGVKPGDVVKRLTVPKAQPEPEPEEEKPSGPALPSDYVDKLTKRLAQPKKPEVPPGMLTSEEAELKMMEEERKALRKNKKVSADYLEGLTQRLAQPKVSPKTILTTEEIKYQEAVATAPANLKERRNLDKGYITSLTERLSKPKIAYSVKHKDHVLGVSPRRSSAESLEQQGGGIRSPEEDEMSSMSRSSRGSRKVDVKALTDRLAQPKARPSDDGVDPFAPVPSESSVKGPRRKDDKRKLLAGKKRSHSANSRHKRNGSNSDDYESDVSDATDKTSDSRVSRGSRGSRASRSSRVSKTSSVNSSRIGSINSKASLLSKQSSSSRQAQSKRKGAAKGGLGLGPSGPRIPRPLSASKKSKSRPRSSTTPEVDYKAAPVKRRPTKNSAAAAKAAALAAAAAAAAGGQPGGVVQG